MSTAIRSPEQDLLDLVVNHTPTRTSELTGGQTAYVRLFTYDSNGDPKRVVYKQINWDWDDGDALSMAAAEVVVARIGAVLGARVPTAVLDPEDPRSVYMEHVLGDPAWVAEGYGVDTDALHSTAAGRRLGLLDLLTQNQDRHGGNWLVAAQDEITGIDHSLSDLSGGTNWSVPDSPFAYSYVEYDFSTGESRLLPIEDLSPAEAARISAGLDELFEDDEFVGLLAQAGGTPRGLMERWAAIAAMAVGND